MTWQPWQPAAAAGFVRAADLAVADPYLVWAEATGFQDFTRVPAGPPERVRVAVELCEDCSPDDLAVALGTQGAVTTVYLGRDTRFCTAQFSAQACARFATPGNEVVRRYELAMPVLPRRTVNRGSRMRERSAPSAVRRALATGETLLAVIDTGCPFAHSAFARAGRTRVLNIWDQDVDPAFCTSTSKSAVPAEFACGREINRKGLQFLMKSSRANRRGAVDEDACYELAGYDELRRMATHGAHVMDQFIGRRRLGDRIAVEPDAQPSWRANGTLPSDEADLVFVQLPRDAWADPNGLALSASVLDGLRYILLCKGEATRRVVVNISCAAYTGAHNGSALLDAALEALVKEEALKGCELQLFMPAGNSYASQWHAAGSLKPGQSGRLRLRVQPGCESPTFLQVWVAAKARDVKWSIKSPRDAAATRMRGAVMLRQKAGVVHAMAQRSESTARGSLTGASTLLMLTLGAAELPDLPGPGGDWEVTVDVRGIRLGGSASVQAYVARNESDLGAPVRHRPARLIDPSYDSTKFLRERVEDDDQPVNPPLLRVLRRDTLAGTVTGPGVQAVAGLRLRPDPGATDYSASGVSLRGSAIADESKALPGIRGAGSRSGCVLRLQGTSFASPQLARVFADQPYLGAGGVAGGSKAIPARVSGLHELFVLDPPAPTRVGAAVAIPRLK